MKPAPATMEALISAIQGMEVSPQPLKQVLSELMQWQIRQQAQIDKLANFQLEVLKKIEELTKGQTRQRLKIDKLALLQARAIERVIGVVEP